MLVGEPSRAPYPLFRCYNAHRVALLSRSTHFPGMLGRREQCPGAAVLHAENGKIAQPALRTHVQKSHEMLMRRVARTLDHDGQLGAEVG